MVSAGAPQRPKVWRRKGVVALALALLAVLGFWLRSPLADVFGKQYEYEEDLTISLDGSATLTVNASLAALATLRGIDVDPGSRTVDRERIRAIYDSAVARVTSVPRPWSRRGRPFVQVNMEVDDVRRLHESPPLSWSRYELLPQNGQTVFKQTVGASALRPGTLKNVGWDGRELVAFRVHFPSRILEHNARDLQTDEPTGIQRGNILSWEQHLSDRLDGKPVIIEVRLDSQSILYRTLWLFAGAFAAAVLTLVALIWWTVRRGASREPPGAA